MTARLERVAADVGEPIDALRSKVAHDERLDVTSLVVSTLRAPETESERLLIESGVQAALLGEFAEIPRDRIDVRVVVPPPTEPTAAPAPPTTEAALSPRDGVWSWIHQQHADYESFFRVYATQMLHAAMRRAIDSYPWRDHSAMRTRLPWLAATYLGAASPAVIVEGIHDAVDALLPPFRALLHPLDCDHALLQARRWLGRDPHSVLELYEAVHRRVTARRPLLQTAEAVLTLYERLSSCTERRWRGGGAIEGRARRGRGRRRGTRGVDPQRAAAAARRGARRSRHRDIPLLQWPSPPAPRSLRAHPRLPMPRSTGRWAPPSGASATAGVVPLAAGSRLHDRSSRRNGGCNVEEAQPLGGGRSRLTGVPRSTPAPTAALPRCSGRAAPPRRPASFARGCDF